jgi:hypothetical protein
MKSNAARLLLHAPILAEARRKQPRLATTYRAARRNAILRPEPPQKRGVWEGAKATYQPYQIKPPIIRLDPLTFKRVVRRRRQPNIYAPNGARECARRRGELQRP